MLYLNQINTMVFLLQKTPKGRSTMSTPTLIKEDSPGYKKHDQLFKELIHTFFQEFLEAFFPEVHDNIDFQSITPYSEEVRTDLTPFHHVLDFHYMTLHLRKKNWKDYIRSANPVELHY